MFILSFVTQVKPIKSKKKEEKKGGGHLLAGVGLIYGVIW